MKKNWLIVSGSILLSLTILYLITFNVMPPLDRRQPGSFTNFYLVIFTLPVLVAPILEEIRFRGFLTNNKVLQSLFLLLTPLGLIITGWNTLVFFLMVMLYCLFFIYKRYSQDWILDLLLIVSSLYFSIHHLPSQANLTRSWLPFLAISFSLGLILSWIIINKSIWWAMLFHGAWNLLGGIIFLLALQFVSEELHIVDGDGYKIEWKRVPFLKSNEGSFSPEGNELQITNMNLQDILGIVNPSLLDSFAISEPFMKYEIKLESEGGYDVLKANLIEALESDSLLLRK
ncbi:CPBP family intramembrane metalloprotease [Algoriphagus kandeliae]|uniref:CPBP family intramembrane metalloprotease n=1 Tax=Algoriphagus kandeliae TaxID=2562278 RepID=A0A4Y9QMI3_9BACT|nr:CPBP family intramembrane glutamic endopeptidase [Algoriphagus kandeliae]TFV93440.1 CPBP family intramembrane metalloprotease [Algoriphagus kandeliae]